VLRSSTFNALLPLPALADDETLRRAAVSSNAWRLRLSEIGSKRTRIDSLETNRWR
jgi:hypothetical protein